MVEFPREKSIDHPTAAHVETSGSLFPHPLNVCRTLNGLGGGGVGRDPSPFP